VQVGAEGADLVDQDRLPLRLDDVQVRVGLGPDPARLRAEQRGDEGHGGLLLAAAARAVEAVGVRRGGQRGPQHAFDVRPAGELERGGRLRHGRPARRARRPRPRTRGRRPGGRGPARPGRSPEGLGDPQPEGLPRRLDAVRLGGRPIDAVQQDGARRAEPGRGERVQGSHGLEPQLTARALVGERRVDEAVRDHPGAAPEGRADDLVDDLRPRGGVEQRLGAGADRPGAVREDERTHLLAEGRPARLPALDHLPPLGPKARREPPGLRRLAHAVQAFEGDEHGAER
jgi:hypothetical protein